MATFSAGDITATATLDRTPFQRDLEAATREGVRFSKRTFTATLDANPKPFYRAIKLASEAGQGFDRRTYSAKLALDRSQLARDLRSAEADVSRFNRLVGKSKLGVDTEGLGGEMRRAERLATSAGITVANNFSSPLRKIKWGLIFSGLTAGLAAAPSGLVALGGAASALVPAFVGPIQALSAFNEAQEAVASGAEDAGEKLDAYQSELAKLTPAAQQFVRQAASMRGEVTAFANTMQSQVLPGFTMLLEGVEDAAPSIAQGVGAIGASLGGVAAQAGELMRNPLFQGELERSFANTVPVVSSLGNLVVNLFRDITTFTAGTREFGLGLAFMIDNVSDGFTRFFNYVQPQSAGLGRTFAALGGLAGDFVAEMGRLVSIVGGPGAGSFESLRAALQNAYDVILNLLSGAMPGLSLAFSGTITAISSFLAVLEPIAPLIGTITGTLVPFVIALKAIDMVTFGRVNRQFGLVKESIAGASGGAGKAKTAIAGLASFAFGPAGIAAGVLGGALMILGQRQQEAAEYAAEHERQVRTLSEAIIQDAGVMGDAANAVIAKSLADQDAAANAKALGISMEQVTAASQGNIGALDAVTASVDRQIAQVLGGTEMNRRFIGTFQGLSQEMVNTGVGANELISQYSSYRRQSITLTEAEKAHLDALLNLKAGTLQNAQQTAEATKAALTLKAAENGVTAATLEHYNALISLNQQLYTQVGSELAVRQASLSLEQAQKASAAALKEHKAGSIEYRQAAANEEQQILSLLTQKYEHAKATSTAVGEERKNVEATRAQQKAAMELAGTYDGPLPAALAKIIGGMDRTSAAALGVKVKINDAGDAVYELPDGKEIKISADTAAANAAIDRVARDRVARIRVRYEGMRNVGERFGQSPGFKDGGRVGEKFADGGQTGSSFYGRYRFPDGGQLQGPGGTRQDLIPLWASNKEFVVNAKATDANLALLQAINSGKFRAEDMGRYAAGGQPGMFSSQEIQNWLPRFNQVKSTSSSGQPIEQLIERAVERAVARTQSTDDMVSALSRAFSKAVREAGLGSVTVQAAPGVDIRDTLDEVLFRSRHAKKGVHSG